MDLECEKWRQTSVKIMSSITSAEKFEIYELRQKNSYSTGNLMVNTIPQTTILIFI